MSEEQARILKRNVSKVMICYDGDQAGMQATLKAAELLEKESCLVKVAVFQMEWILTIIFFRMEQKLF